MLSRYHARRVEHALRAASFDPPFPPASDRAAWEALAASVGAEVVGTWIAAAERAASEPVADLPATLYLEYRRVGRREGYQTPYRLRRTRLGALAVAECLEGRGRFLDPLLDLAWAICEESSWAYPAHQTDLADPDHPTIDLGAAMTALALAELDAVLGARLDPALGARIRREVDRRCLTPYLARHDYQWMYSAPGHMVNNWCGVCNGGVVGSAVYLEEDPARLAEIVARAARSLDDYLASFDVDGGSTEGASIWAYGFGYYTILADLLERRTAGAVDLFDEPVIRETARYPLRTLLHRGAYANFSDALREGGQTGAHLAYLSRRLDIPDLMRLARASGAEDFGRQELPWAFRRLFWAPSEEPAGAFMPARHDWFRGMAWMIARYDPADPDALVLAARGGHNAENHNQNDIGSVIVDLCGEPLVAELGRPCFTSATFGAGRYEILANSSLGHSVPIANGCAQPAGERYRAEVVEHAVEAGQDRLVLELRDAYPPEADLASLRRTVVLHRDAPRGWVEIEDRARFAGGPGRLEAQLVTFSDVEVSPGAVLIRGIRGRLRVEYPEGAEVEVLEDRGVALSAGPADVRRIRFSLPASREAAIRLRLVPHSA
jgi:hypothetical protein